MERLAGTTLVGSVLLTVMLVAVSAAVPAWVLMAGAAAFLYLAITH